jgi:hypothetical protein
MIFGEKWRFSQNPIFAQTSIDLCKKRQVCCFLAKVFSKAKSQSQGLFNKCRRASKKIESFPSFPDLSRVDTEVAVPLAFVSYEKRANGQSTTEQNQ